MSITDRRCFHFHRGLELGETTPISVSVFNVSTLAHGERNNCVRECIKESRYKGRRKGKKLFLARLSDLNFRRSFERVIESFSP